MYLTLAAAVAALLAGFWGGLEWQQGRDAIKLQEAQEQTRRLSKAADEKGIEHAETVDKLNALQGRVRTQVYGLSTGRECLSARAVRLLNAADGTNVPAAASEPASASAAFATDRDVGDALAICRGEHTKLRDQLNSILDIEDKRTDGK